MKKMYKTIIFVISLSRFIGCTNDFEELNSSKFTTNEVNPGFLLFKSIQNGLFSCSTYSYELGDQLHTDLFAQYYGNAQSSFTTDRYLTRTDWIEIGLWSPYYQYGVTRRWNVFTFLDEYPEYSNMYQIFRIIDAIGAQKTTDLFGDIPYSEAGQGIMDPKFDAQKEIYYTLFEELKDAVAQLRSNTKQKEFTGLQDIMYLGDEDKWIKLANAERLRLALRISFIDPAKAKAEGELALADVSFESNADNASYTVNIGTDDQGHPLYYISLWGDVTASTFMMNTLESESSVVDPRLTLWFAKTHDYLTGESTEPFRGMPNGLLASELDGEYSKDNTSQPWGYYWGTNWNDYKPGDNIPNDPSTELGVSNKPRVVFNYAELCFLKAEAALRGWAGAGDAKTNYENGIRASFAEFRDGVDATKYSTANDEAYINGGNVKYNSGDNFETNLKKIITQKWLAIYPNGQEAWIEFRRTGYPDLIPPAHVDIDNVKQGEFLKKLPYTDAEKQGNTNALDQSLNQGQGDGEHVRVWWDTNRYN